MSDFSGVYLTMAVVAVLLIIYFVYQEPLQ